jgi:DNA adenine methylase
MIPEHRCYVEPFAGAAAVLFHKPPSDVEVLNDVNLDLVNLYRVVQHHLDELVRQFRWSLVSRTMFEWAKMQRPETLTDVQRAARFYYLQRTAFGSKVVGQNFGVSPTVPPRLNLLRMEEELSHAHLRLARVLVEALPWQQICPRYDRPGTVFFCDPPYWDTVGYGVPFGLSEYKALARFMRSAAGKVLLTINDHPAMREVFRRFEFEAVDITYTIGGQGRSSPVRELVYRSWKAP